ncbi:hypothetical protein GCM10009736_32430 [Actinomadura bangladeshensis]
MRYAFPTMVQLLPATLEIIDGGLSTHALIGEAAQSLLRAAASVAVLAFVAVILLQQGWLPGNTRRRQWIGRCHKLGTTALALWFVLCTFDEIY